MRTARIPDWRGAEIREGCKVAYNMSGDIVLGRVEKILPSAILVMLLIPACGKQPGHISRVRRPRSMLVVSEDA